MVTMRGSKALVHVVMDPEILALLDKWVSAHHPLNRSNVIEEAVAMYLNENG